MEEAFNRIVGSRLAYAALAALVFIASLPGLIAMPVLDRDEGRFTQASSEMMESGDYVVIRYRDHLRNKKPVAIHWMQSATVSLTGGPQGRAIGAYRLPSLLGAMLAAMATFWGGTALFSRRAAFLGAALLGASLLLTTEAHIAKTDAAQAGVLALMMGALAHLRIKGVQRTNRLAVIFWVCFALGVLLKGVIAPLVGGLTIIGLFIWERRLEWAKPLLYWGGLSLFCIITIPWYIAVQIATGGDFLMEAAKVDLGQKIVSAAEGHSGPPGLHIAALPFLFWPGTLLLIPGFWYGISSLWRREKDPALQAGARPSRNALPPGSLDDGRSWRFLACWIIPAWLVFEIAPTKLVHYTLPMYPAIALACGAAFDHWFRGDRYAKWNFGRWISLPFFIVTTLVLIVVSTPWALAELRADAAKDFGPLLMDRVSVMWRDQWNATGVGYWPAILIALAAGATIWAFVKKMPLLIFGGLIACSLVGGISYRAIILPQQSWILSTGAALDALKEICALPEDTARWKKSGCAQEVVNNQPLRAPKVVRAIAYAEPSLVFELGGKMYLPPEAKAELPTVAEDNRPAWLINAGEKEGRDALDALVKAAAAADRCIRFSRRYAWNYSNGDPSILVAAVVEPAGCPSSGAPPELRPGPDEEEPLLDAPPTPN